MSKHEHKGKGFNLTVKQRKKNHSNKQKIIIPLNKKLSFNQTKSNHSIKQKTINQTNKKYGESATESSLHKYTDPPFYYCCFHIGSNWNLFTSRINVR